MDTSVPPTLPPPLKPTDQQGQQPTTVQPAQHRRVAELAAAASTDNVRPIQEQQRLGNFIPGGPMDPKFALPPPAPEIKSSPPPSPHSSQGMGEQRAPLEEEVEDLDEQQRAGYLAEQEKEKERKDEDDLNTLLEISIRMEEEKEKEKEKEGEDTEKQQKEGM